MNNRIKIIFLLSVMCYCSGVNAVFGEHTLDNVRDTTKRAYMITRKKTRTVYEKIKKNKRFIIGIVAYLALEALGYAEDWDTPLQRLLRPKKLFDDLTRQLGELENRCKGLDKQLQDKEFEALEKQRQSLLEEMEKFMQT